MAQGNGFSSHRAGLSGVLAVSTRLVLANRGLRRIALVWGSWVAGEWAVIVVLSVSAYGRGGTAAVAVVAAVRTLPAAVTGPLMSVLADRIPRARVLVGALLSWALLIAMMPLALRAHTLLALYVAVGLAAVASTVIRPAINGLIPQVVDGAEELAAANSTYSIVEAAGSLLGPLLIGLLLAVCSDTVCYFCIAGLFALAAALAVGIETDFQPPERRAGAGRRSLLEPLAGFPALTRTVQLRAVFAIFMAQTLTRGFLNVFVVSIAVSLLGQNVATTGVLFSALGAGGLFGAVLTLAGVRWRPALPFALGMALWGLPLVLIAAWPRTAVVWLAIAVIGVGNAVGDVFGFTLFHRLIPDHLLGRAFGAFWGTAAATQALGAVLAPPLIAWLDLRGALTLAGTVMTVVPLSCLLLLRRMDDDLAVDDDRVETLGRCAVLAPLTRVALEHLARDAIPIRVAEGRKVIEQGEVGDSFFVIVNGVLAALVNGREARRMTSGDCFGEIAALNRTPRTATVIAVQDCDLLCLDGATFVLAVTGHRPAQGAALGLSEQRLESDPDA